MLLKNELQTLSMTATGHMMSMNITVTFIHTVETQVFDNDNQNISKHSCSFYMIS